MKKGSSWCEERLTKEGLLEEVNIELDLKQLDLCLLKIIFFFST